MEALAGIILAPEEMAVWRQMAGAKQRRGQWLRGRIAAKDAVRSFVKENLRIELSPEEILISNDPNGRPSASGKWSDKLKRRLCISISHAGPVSAAVADGITGIGIDIELIGRKQDGLEEEGFCQEERALLSGIAGHMCNDWRLRAWCAKESLSKALGSGLEGNPSNILLHRVNPETGEIKLRLSDQFAKRFPGYADRIFSAFTGCDRGLIFAISTL